MSFGKLGSRIRSSETFSRLASWIVITLVILSVSESVTGYHVCNANNIQAFCVIPNHFKALYASVTTKPPYPQFKEILELPKFGEMAPKVDLLPSAVGEYFGSYNRYCELKYIKGKYESGKVGSPGDCGFAKENPYSLEVTEIEVNGQRMHNWLHIKIKSDRAKRDAFTSGGGQVTGKIKYAFLVAHNDISYAVGDFNNHLPCGSDCNCRPPDCYQASPKDSVPCMYNNYNVLSAPGQMMMYSALGVEEIHATWRFAQFQHKDTFTTELHFKAYLIESKDPVKGDAQEPAGGSATYNFDAVLGWTPTYDILWLESISLNA